jgi:TPP-dependent pyruvate/acetoin dehydrogenase alpha subunit
MDAALLDRIDAEAHSEVDQAREEAKAAPLADPAGVERQVFADGGAQWRR